MRLMSCYENNEDLLNLSFVHKLNSKLKLLYIFRKLQFAANLILIGAPFVYACWAMYMIVKPFDTIKVTDEKGRSEYIQFNTGALIFANILQLTICLLFIAHGIVSVIYIIKDPEEAVKILDYLIVSNSITVSWVFFIYSIIRIWVYTVGMENWMVMKSAQISTSQYFDVDGERNFDLGSHKSTLEIRWTNFTFIFPGIVLPCIMIYIVFWIAFLFLAVVNNIHRKKITDRDNYIMTLYKSRKIQEYIENLRNKGSSEEELNDRDDKFDINNEISESVKKFDQNMMLETLRNSLQQNTEFGIRESLQLQTSNLRDSRQHFFSNMRTAKINPVMLLSNDQFDQCNRSSEVEMQDQDGVIWGDSEEFDIENKDPTHLDSKYAKIIRSADKGTLNYSAIVNVETSRKEMNNTL